MTNHSKVRTEAETKFRKTLKATWKGKRVTTHVAVALANKKARIAWAVMAPAGELPAHGHGGLALQL